MEMVGSRVGVDSEGRRYRVSVLVWNYVGFFVLGLRR